MSSKISVSELTANNVGTLKKLHEFSIPIEFSDDFYTHILQEPDTFNKLVFYQDLPVGAVVSRLSHPSDDIHSARQAAYLTDEAKDEPATSEEPKPKSKKKKRTKTGQKVQRLYVVSLSVLEPYRKLGLGTALLEDLIQEATETHNYKAPAEKPDKPESVPAKITAIYTHVQEGDTVTIELYKKHGFEVTETVQDFYTHLRPSSVITLTKSL